MSGPHERPVAPDRERAPEALVVAAAVKRGQRQSVAAEAESVAGGELRLHQVSAELLELASHGATVERGEQRRPGGDARLGRDRGVHGVAGLAYAQHPAARPRDDEVGAGDDRGTHPPGDHHEQMVLPNRELAPDPERGGQLAVPRPAEATGDVDPTAAVELGAEALRCAADSDHRSDRVARDQRTRPRCDDARHRMRGRGDGGGRDGGTRQRRRGQRCWCQPRR